MFIKQLSIFVENKPGRLAEITSTLGEHGVNIRALSISDTRDFGIFRLIVNQPDEAEKCLKEAGYTVCLAQVIAVVVEDCPGSLAKAMQILYENGISIDYAYAFLSKPASVIIRVSDDAAAVEVLQKHGIQLIKSHDAFLDE